ncbi:ATP-binding protein [Paenibacillus allorhizosphaerae]|uniref:Sensor histidine kinase RcsC n=1 Tax=Paenibacillus allorhizosphaerae TaxID=2849866 RepID=A0ABN7TVJ7_9BACL|nr:ATP-binding protein [Paenibacillus allorhizosphaerae]CAG7652216.1 Sensor histidine kinase RcsC [Paenibacillus allorhizosphaerae]
MISILKDYLLNIFIIFSPLVVFPYIYRFQYSKYYRVILCVLFSLSIMVTMSFAVSINGLSHDFRAIPLTVGSLYGGPQVSVVLYLALILYRLLMGNVNGLYHVISMLPTFLLFVFLFRMYARLSLTKKIICAILVSALVKFFTFSIYLLLLNETQRLTGNPLVVLSTYLLQSLIIGMYIYLVEFLQNYFRMQEEMIRSEKLKLVSEMAASVAHEIRNPLTTVRGFIQLLGTSGASAERKSYYEKICLEELDRAQHIITDYLSLAKTEAEAIETIDMNQEVDYLANILLTYANYNNVKVEARTTEEALYMVGDKHKLRQALINIGKNAIEAMSSDGLLTIDLQKRGQTIVLHISDNGVGMTPEQLNRLGSPYFSTKDKGTGLGTMVSINIIKKMDGKIDIKSQVGTGTVFEISFPEGKKGS